MNHDPLRPPRATRRGRRRRHDVAAWAAQDPADVDARDATAAEDSATSSLPAASALSRAGLAGARRLGGTMRSMFETGGKGFRNLALTHAASAATDALVALGLAGTLFFSVPSAEARGNVAVYLLLTVAPFAVIGPVLGRVLDRSPVATRGTLVAAAAGRGVLALLLVASTEGLWLFPAAFGLLLLSRVHTITRNALLPLALDQPRALVAANARLAWVGVLAGALAAALGGSALWLLDARGPMALAVVTATTAAVIGRRLPEPDGVPTHRAVDDPPDRLHLPRPVRLAQLATAGVRAFNGFLLLLLAFELQEAEARLLDFGALLAAAGVGYAVASRLVPRLERHVPEEPMVVAALAMTAAAAFTAGQWFGILAATALAGAAGIAWGVAKLAFDGLLQASVPASRRGAAFTRSETAFALAWVAGAIVPTVVPLPASVGLALAGLGALAAQIVYVAALLVPVSARQGDREAAPDPPDLD